jgi:hypothetical protein
MSGKVEFSGFPHLTHPLKAAGAADKAAIQRVKVPSCQLPDSGI